MKAIQYSVKSKIFKTAILNSINPNLLQLRSNVEVSHSFSESLNKIILDFTLKYASNKEAIISLKLLLKKSNITVQIQSNVRYRHHSDSYFIRVKSVSEL